MHWHFEEPPLSAEQIARIHNARDLCINAGLLFDPMFNVFVLPPDTREITHSSGQYITIGSDKWQFALARSITQCFHVATEQERDDIEWASGFYYYEFLFSFHKRKDAHIEWKPFYGATHLQLDVLQNAYATRKDYKKTSWE